jgi:hypothetical protein
MVAIMFTLLFDQIYSLSWPMNDVTEREDFEVFTPNGRNRFDMNITMVPIWNLIIWNFPYGWKFSYVKIEWTLL